MESLHLKAASDDHVMSLINENKQLSEQLSLYRTQNIVLSQKISIQEGLFEIHKSKYDRLFADYQYNKRQHETDTTMISSLKSQIKNLYATMAENRSDFEIQQQESSEKFVAMENRLKSQCQQIKQCHTDLHRYSATINDLKSKLWDKDLNISQLNMKLQNLMSQLQTKGSDYKYEPHIPSPSALKIPTTNNNEYSKSNNLQKPKLTNRYSKSRSRSISRSRYSYSVSRAPRAGPKFYTNQMEDHIMKVRKSISSTAFRFPTDLERDLGARPELYRPTSIQTSTSGCSTSDIDTDGTIDDYGDDIPTTKLTLNTKMSGFHLSINDIEASRDTVTPLDSYDKKFENAYENIDCKAFGNILVSDAESNNGYEGNETEFESECDNNEVIDKPETSDISKSRKSVSSIRSRLLQSSQTELVGIVEEDICQDNTD